MKITVAVCTYRRFDLLGKCLESLNNQSINKNKYEILVIDNSLQPEKSYSFKESLNGFENLEYVITEECGIAFARNVALKRCKTKVLAFTDDDCITPSNWLETILSEFSALDESVAVIGGRILPLWETEKPEWLEKRFFHQLALIDWGEERMPIYHSDGKWLLTANAAYRTNALHKAGGFPMHLGRKRKLPLAQEEYAANQKLLELGFLMVYIPWLSVKHFMSQERVTKNSLLKDAFWDGVSQVLLKTQGVDSNDTDRLSEELMPLQEQLLYEIDTSIPSDILFEKANEFRRKGFIEARRALVLKKRIESYTDSVWPVVYIVTPSLNAADTIDQTIMSIVTQTGDFSVRYHVQDGGSTDGTLKKLEEWKRRLINWRGALLKCRNIVFSYKSQNDYGMYDAISKGFDSLEIPSKVAMCWINADDYLMPGALATVQQAFLMSEDIAWIIGPVHSCTEREYLYGSHFYGFPLAVIRAGLCDGFHWQHIQQEGTFWRKLLWDKVGGLDLSFKYAGDWDLWRRFSRHCTPVQTSWPLGCFRRRTDQLSRNNMFNYNSEVDSKVPFTQRQDALNYLLEEKEDIKIQVLISRSDQSYAIKKSSLSSESIPGITWQNCPGFAAELLKYFSEKNTDSINKKGKSPAPGAETFQPVLSKDLSSKKPSSIKTHWKLSHMPGQPYIYFGSGWHPQESDSEGWWRWCAGQGIVQIEAFKMRKAGLFLTVASVFQKDEISIHLNGKAVFSHTIGLEPREIGPAILNLKAGTNILLISSKMTSGKLAKNSGSRSFVIKNVKTELTGSRLPDFRNLIAISRVARSIRKSSLFMPEYYHNQVPELKESNQCSEIHYLLYGAWDNKDPNPLFNSAWYLSKYRDVYTSGENPLCHYMANGWIEGRDPHPQFSTERYLRNYLDVRKSGMNPLQHYLLHGILEGRKIHPST